jgi:hypothetical protein
VLWDVGFPSRGDRYRAELRVHQPEQDSFVGGWSHHIHRQRYHSISVVVVVVVVMVVVVVNGCCTNTSTFASTFNANYLSTTKMLFDLHVRM